MVTNISCIRSANLGSKLNQLWISDSGDILSILLVTCCCSLSMTAVCIGTTSGSPKNCRASSGVQSISMFTFISAPDRAFDRFEQYRHDRHCRASEQSQHGTGRGQQLEVWSTDPARLLHRLGLRAGRSPATLFWACPMIVRNRPETAEA